MLYQRRRANQINYSITHVSQNGKVIYLQELLNNNKTLGKIRDSKIK